MHISFQRLKLLDEIVSHGFRVDKDFNFKSHHHSCMNIMHISLRRLKLLDGIIYGIRIDKNFGLSPYLTTIIWDNQYFE